MDTRAHEGCGLLDPAVHAERQTVTRLVDGIAHLVQPIRGIAHHVKHGTEHFALQLTDAFDLEGVRREEHAALEPGRDGKLAQELRRARNRLRMRRQCFACRFVDDGTDVGVERHGIAELQLVHGAQDDRQHLVGHFVLQKQHAQGRAALSRAVERRRQYVARHLFGQCGRVHDHGVLSAGFRDQRGDRPRTSR